MNGQWEELSALFPSMVNWRRHLHEHPELSYQEENTAKFIAKLLDEWGVETIKGVAGHAIVGIISGELPGPTVALRADMDALPIQDEKACEYASKTAGVMHACGHDAHTATLLALGRYFSNRKDLLRGTIILVFQHAEELSPGGAQDILSSGVLDEADVIYGVHLWTPLQAGHVYSAPGAIMAAADEFNIHIEGKGGHGGMPHATVDSIYIAAQTVVGLQSIVSRNVDPIEPCVVSIGVIQAGTAFNIIAEQCKIVGTVRSFNEEVRELTKNRMKRIVESTAEMYGGRASFEFIKGYPPVVNDTREASRFTEVADRTFGEERVHGLQPIMAGEDFAYYLQRIPGCFMLVGAGNAEQGIVQPHHHPKFDIDESAMLQAAQLLASMALDYMQENSEQSD
jgi:amidohydrolase